MEGNSGEVVDVSAPQGLSVANVKPDRGGVIGCDGEPDVSPTPSTANLFPMTAVSTQA